MLDRDAGFVIPELAVVRVCEGGTQGWGRAASAPASDALVGRCWWRAGGNSRG
jgi:hypothetical protein